MDRINVTRSSMPPFEEYCEEIRSIWESRWLTNMGEKHEALTQALREKLEVPGISLFTNGHLALEATLRALDLRGEVITTPFTFASTTHAIARCGLKPVFCDVREGDYTIDPAKIEALITRDTCAILPVHVYGNICDDAAIEAVARAHGLKVIYDAAHAFGERVNGVSVARLGDASMFSFHATKVFHTIEGGAVAYRDEALTTPLQMQKNYGITSPETVEVCGGNSKMSEFQAAMGLCNLRWMKTIDNSHRECAAKRPVSCAARTTKSFGRGFRHRSSHFKPVAAAESGAFRRPSEPAPIHRTA